jgi:hypothetical protein
MVVGGIVAAVEVAAVVVVVVAHLSCSHLRHAAEKETHEGTLRVKGDPLKGDSLVPGPSMMGKWAGSTEMDSLGHRQG